MKISQLIKLLQQIMYQHGDLEVFAVRKMLGGGILTFWWNIENSIRVEGSKAYLLFRKMSRTEWRIARGKK